MAPVAHSFVVTAWRDPDDLLQLRADLYALGEAEQQRRRRRRAVDKVRAWKVRKGELPLLLEATADLVEAGLAERGDGDEDGEGALGHYGLRLLYGGAISRFVTGFADTQLQLRRSKPSWYLQSRSQSQSQSHPSSPGGANSPSTPFLTLPFSLLETRHCIVHREYPSLVTLKHAARQSLDWLWEWYWSRLDSVFTNVSSSHDASSSITPLSGSTDEAKIVETLQTVLKTYTRARKQEIKQNAKVAAKASPAADVAFQTCESLLASNNALYSSSPAVVVLRILTKLFVIERAIIPADRKLRASMSGAFLIWTPLLVALASSRMEFLQRLLDGLIDGITSIPSSPREWTGTADAVANDPLCEALHAWIVHIATASSWRGVRKEMAAREVAWGRGVVEYVLETCLTSPTYWSLKVVERVLKEGEVENGGSWEMLLAAARSEGEDEDVDMDMDVDVEAPEKEKTGAESRKEEKTRPTEKLRGPQKRIGLWKRQPIGLIPPGWEDDE